MGKADSAYFQKSGLKAIVAAETGKRFSFVEDGDRAKGKACTVK